METIKLSNIQILIFDMDGTLYEHDGEDNTFKNSSLFRVVMENSALYVQEREKCSLKKAERLVKIAHTTDTIGISNFMAKRYNITRSEFFDVVWNIDPARIVKNFKTQQDVLKVLKDRGFRLFLLTGAPRIWMDNVLGFLGLNNYFERQFNGEMFGSKNEVFENLSQEFNPGNILSVGDQLDTDIEPALRLGMKALVIQKPSDLKKLINKI